MSRTKLNKLRQIDGKIHVEDSDNQGDTPKFEPTTLAQVFGSTGLERYHTLDKEEYLSQLSQMNLADLRIHATKVGIIPRDVSTERLKKQLVSAFLQYVSGYQKPLVKPRDVRPTEEALRIMSAVK